MKLGGMLPYRTALSGLVLLAYLVRADDLTNAYCSSENTGSSFKAVYSIYQSMGACQQTCEAKYAFAILQGKYCWCSSYAPADQVSVGECNQDCPGYPSDQCGNTNKDLYGYVSLSLSVKGTATPSSSTTSAATSTSTAETTSVVSQVVTATVTQQQSQSPSVVVSYVTPGSSSSQAPSSSKATTTANPKTTTRVTTIAGAPVTQTVTTTPYYASPNANHESETKNTTLSGGAIAGIVIGGLVGLAALVFAGFLLWRRRRSSDSEGGGEGGVKRKTSVLSKTGLLYPFRPTSMSENNYDDHHYGGGGQPTRSNSVRHSMMFGGSSGAGDGVSPASPLAVSTEGSGSSRGRSRPPQRLYDQRLNPSALYPSHSNSSRVSIQDQQDYSRPLGVTNPDVRKSTDSG